MKNSPSPILNANPALARVAVEYCGAPVTPIISLLTVEKVSAKHAPRQFVQLPGLPRRPLPNALNTASLAKAAFGDMRQRMNLDGRRTVIIGLGIAGREAFLVAKGEGAVVEVFQPGLSPAEIGRLRAHLRKSPGLDLAADALRAHGWEQALAAASVCVLALPASPSMCWEVGRNLVSALSHGSTVIVSGRGFLPRDAVTQGLRSGRIGAIYDEA